MTGQEEAVNREGHDERAAGLARMARWLDGSVGEAEHDAGRARMLMAFGATSRLRSARWLLAAAALVCGAVLLAVLWVRTPAPLEYRISGPLITDGDWLGVAPDGGALSVRFSDGTEIELGPGSKSRVADVTAEGARVVLGAGWLGARVVHQPRARWTIAAGPYSIEVTGTAFDVGWSTSGERLDVSLHDGSVVVRGPSLADGIRVAAGQRLVAHARTGGAELSSLFAPDPPEPRADAPSIPPSGSERAPAQTADPPAPARASASWAELLAAGNFRGVLEGAEARGIEVTLSRSSLADLVALSDAARYVRDRALARRGLSAERARFPGSAEARAAAFVLGRMADDSGSRTEALRWYDSYLSESPNGSFATEALGRKLVVLVDAGNADAARAVATEYVKRFPGGPHAAYARELLAHL